MKNANSKDITLVRQGKRPGTPASGFPGTVPDLSSPPAIDRIDVRGRTVIVERAPLRFGNARRP